MNSKKTVFLLTSTSQPYQRDALDLVFLPQNISYRFRYHKKWLSTDLKDEKGEIDKNKVSDLEGKEVIIVHILIESEEKNYRVLEYLPLRKARINQCRALGEFLWIGFVLGDWITYKNTSQQIKNEYHEFIKNYNPANSDILTELVFIKEGVEISTIPDKSGDINDIALRNWNQIASNVSRYAFESNKTSKHPIMLKLIGVRSVDGDNVIKPKRISKNLYGFELISGRSYFCDIAEYCTENIEPFELELKTEERTITPTIRTVEVRGKYDILRFMIRS